MQNDIVHGQPRRSLWQKTLNVLTRLVTGRDLPKPRLMRARPFMTEREWQIYLGLRKNCPTLFFHAQVATASLIEPRQKQGTKEWWRLRNLYCQRIIDFVVTDKSGRIVALIEIDDKSHNGFLKQAKDEERDSLMAMLGFKTLRYKHSIEETIRKASHDLIALTS